MSLKKLISKSSEEKLENQVSIRWVLSLGASTLVIFMTLNNCLCEEEAERMVA